MEKNINGLHHITVLASDPQKNYDFYTKILGLRFVKKTVNFDAPDVYHLYYADEVGTPGSVLTFFPFPMAKRGTRGTGEANIVSFAIPGGSLDFWVDHLKKHEVGISQPAEKFGFQFIAFLDPDGMKIELVEDDVADLIGWESDSIPRMHSIRKFFGATVYLRNADATEKLVTEVMGFNKEAEHLNVKRFISGQGKQRAFVDIQADPNGTYATQSAGSVHHIAWRTESAKAQREWIDRLFDAGFRTTDVIDRTYFHSIYFREPGGVLFEIATDKPGFAIDEPQESLGQALKLPPQYENMREKIELKLIPLKQ